MHLLRLLLVEDNPIHAMIMKQMLGDGGGLAALQHVGDGEDAIDFLERRGRHAQRPQGEDPHLVLLDIRLPSIDGFDVLRAIRESDQTRGLPVVMVSTSDDPQDVEQSYRMGANGFVCKDADFAAFSERLQTLRRYWSEVVELPGA